MPKPSDPPRPDGGFIDKKKLAQLAAQLDQAVKTIHAQRGELLELREAVDRQVGELATRLEDLDTPREADPRLDALEERLAAIEARPASTPSFHALGEADAVSERIETMDSRLHVLEERTGEVRIRMRLERTGHRVEELERRLALVDESQRAATEGVEQARAASADHGERLTRIESLFEELAEELRHEREAVDLDGVRARLDDLETLVLQTGTDEETLRKKLVEQERALATLRESMVPGAPAGDDLTRIKGIGPKYARLLADMGVTSFAQMAAWTGEDLERAAAHLGIPASRIEKAGWVAAAAKLAT